MNKNRITYLVFFVCLFLAACRTKHRQPFIKAVIPEGRWVAAELTERQKKLRLTGNEGYYFELNKDSSLAVYAEDNRLTGLLVYLGADSFSLSDPIKTDVCCDSDTARLFFTAMADPMQYRVEADTLWLNGDGISIRLYRLP